MDVNERTINRVPNICAVIFGICAVFMLFAPNIVFGGTESVDCSGLNVAFGTPVVQEMGAYEGSNYMSVNILSAVFTISPIAIAYLLALAGIVCTVLNIFGIGGKVIPIVSGSCFVVAAVMLFISNYLVIFNPKYIEEVGVGVDVVRASLKLGMGSIAGGTLCGVSGLAMLAAVFLPKPRLKIKFSA